MYESLEYLDTQSTSSAISYKGNNKYDFPFSFLQTPSEKWSVLKGICSERNSFLSEQIPFQKKKSLFSDILIFCMLLEHYGYSKQVIF